MSVSRDKKRGTWTVEAWYRNSMGERHKKTKRGFASKKEAVAWERDFLASCDERVEVTVEAFVKTMYARDIYPRLRVGTRLTKDAIIDKYILPIFGPMRLCDVKAADVVRWENWLLEQNLSQSYLHTICNQFSAVFNHAVRFYRLPQNPMLAAGKVGSKRPEKEMLYWTPAEFKRFSQAIEDKPLIYLAFLTLYLSGCREGELLALRPEDIDFNLNVIRIRHSYARIKGEDVIGPPKTRASKRDIVMPSLLREELRDYLSTHPEIAPTDRLFPVTKHALSHEMKRGCELSGVKRIRIHDIRHSHVSALINSGYSPTAIADRMGHETAEVTEMYSHLFPSTQHDLVEALDEVMSDV